MTRGSSIVGAVVDVGGPHDREVGVFEQLQRRPFERALRAAPMRSTAGQDRLPADDQPVADIDLGERAQLAVLRVPRARRELGAQALSAARARCGLGSCAKRRDARLHERVEVGLGPVPVARRRTRRRSRPARAPARSCTTSRCALDVGRARRVALALELEDLGEVVGDEPERRRRTTARSRRSPAGARRAASRRSPARESCQWCTVSIAIAASNVAVAERQTPPRTRRTAGAAPGGRCAIIVGDGSTATTDAVGRFVATRCPRRRCTTRARVAERGVDAGLDARIGRAGRGRTTCRSCRTRVEVHGSRAQQRHHLDGGRGRLFALVALLAAEPVERLLAVVDRQHAEDRPARRCRARRA